MDCKIWTGRTKENGQGSRYGIVSRNGRDIRVHRATWEDAYGPIPEGLSVLHTCDVMLCYELTHLYLGTPLDNARDREQRGRGVRLTGTAHPLTRIEPTVVKAVRELGAGGVSGRELARRFAVSQTHVRRILNYESRRHDGLVI